MNKVKILSFINDVIIENGIKNNLADNEILSVISIIEEKLVSNNRYSNLESFSCSRPILTKSSCSVTRHQVIQQDSCSRGICISRRSC